jgi:hypothetical protein
MTAQQIRESYIRKCYPDMPSDIITIIAERGVVNTCYSDYLEQLVIQANSNIPSLDKMHKTVADVEFYYKNAIKWLDEDQINALSFMLGSYIKQYLKRRENHDQIM